MVADDKKRITISLSETMYDKLKLMADNDRRTMSNFIATLIEKAANEYSKDEA